MVRTKADGAMRVAAGGKAPKKSAPARPSPASSPSESYGKDNFPVNKYCPRETPAWQKKITFFIDRVKEVPADVVEVPVEPSVDITKRSKRSSSVLDESNEMDADEAEVSTKKFKASSHAEQNGSMEME